MSQKTALLIVDVQQDYLSRLGADAQGFLQATEELLGAVRRLGWPVIHIQTRVSADLHDAMPHLRNKAQAACVEGTPGAEAPRSLAPQPAEHVFYKRFYSGFEDPHLEQKLRERGVGTLIVAGLYTHACVRSTVLDAYAHGFESFLATDCLASYDALHAAIDLEWMNGRAAQCLPSHEILALLSGGTSPVPAGKTQTWTHRNPAAWSEVLGEVELCRESELASVLDSVAARQRTWQTARLHERTERIAAWSRRLAQQRSRWVETLIRDVGKPRIDAEGEVSYGLSLLETVCDQLRSDEPFEMGRVRYRPHGAVGIITPWNNPFAIPIGKIAPALGYGNAVLWKPALPASALSRAIVESLAAEGLDAMVGLVTGDARTGMLLARAPRVAALSFTGSIPVGRQLINLYGTRARPLQAELGGNNAAIVLQDADIASAARDLAVAMFSFAGQRCTAISRLIVQRDIFKTFAESLCAAVEALKVGFPSEGATQVGPVISKERQTELLAIVQRERARGASVIAGGAVPAGVSEDGCFIAPTIATGLAPDSPIALEELFGPVVALMPADDFPDALAQHNSGEHGLLGALFSHDAQTVARFLAEAQAGILSINQARPRFEGSAPFGGWKSSGFGQPEHGRWDREFYTRVQAVYDDG